VVQFAGDFSAFALLRCALCTVCTVTLRAVRSLHCYAARCALFALLRCALCTVCTVTLRAVHCLHCYAARCVLFALLRCALCALCTVCTSVDMSYTNIAAIIFFPMTQQPLGGLGRLLIVRGFTITLIQTHHTR
jgi:hypothetical protein